MKIREKAKLVTQGVIDALCLFLLWCVVGMLIINTFGCQLDPTDKDGWNRSGLKYYKDHGTGIEYISGRNGNLIERYVAEDGR